MARKPFKPQILTANDLLDGDVLFWHAAGWSPEHCGAKVAHSPEEAAALEADGRREEAENRVVGAYLVEVSLDCAGCPQPVHYRERIRTRGPSHRPDLDRKTDTSRHEAA